MVKSVRIASFLWPHMEKNHYLTEKYVNGVPCAKKMGGEVDADMS